MKSTNQPNINTKKYWDMVYETEAKRSLYAKQGTSVCSENENLNVGTHRFQQTLKLIAANDSVLDIGCGVGVFTKLVKDTYPKADVWGVDISPKAIEANSKVNPEITYKVHKVGQKPPFPNNRFDLVFSGEVVEHLDKPDTLFKEAYNALKPGGKLVITTPYEDRITSPEHVWIFSHDAIERLYYSNNFQHVEFINLPDMEHLLVIYGIGTKKI